MEETETSFSTEPDKSGQMEDVHIENFLGTSRLRDIDQGWAWVALLACFVSMIVLGGCLSSVGIIHLYLLEAFGESDTKTAWVGAIFIGLHTLSGPLASAISSRWSCRTSIFIGGVLGPSALAIGSQTQILGMALLTVGILSGIGFGLVLGPVNIVMGYYFHRRLNVVLGMMTVGVPIGIAGAPACLTFLEAQYGWRGSLLVFAGITLNICVAAALLKPTVLELRHRGNKPIAGGKGNPTQNDLCTKCCCKSCFVPQNTYEVLTNKGLIFYVLTLLLSNLAMSTLYLHLPKYCLVQGASVQDLHRIYVTMGCANVISKVLTGLGSGKIQSGESIDIFCLMLGAYSVAGTTLCVLPWVSHSQLGRVICFYLVSFYYNVEPPLFVPVSMELVGLGNLNMALGLEMFGIGVGFIIGPPLAAWVQQISGDYQYCIYLASVSFILAAVSTLMIMKEKVTSESSDESLSSKHPELRPEESTSSI